ncbi:uncharacterized protein LOC113228257 [Hyposmocoma kahamanoa]|uniref:uncharacterized protein LOC113228257 n=1 Tax=Hyposmocoma kahamanoa TaxID=1477025 RepID=UPI000E6D7DFE|nr:uncharacterized protein LOC113228257 [Hyposmocoma kahamanoa]
MLIVLCIFACLGRGVLGYLGDDLAETSQLCCNQGTSYARNHSSEDCSSSIPPDVPKQFAALCIFAMDQCCKEYFQKKRDCDNGVEIATSRKSCDSTRDSVKNCCDECLRGTSTSSTGLVESCQYTTRGSSADQLLAGAAFEECCKKALNTNSGNSSFIAHERSAVTSSRKPSSSVSSK